MILDAKPTCLHLIQVYMLISEVKEEEDVERINSAIASSQNTGQRASNNYEILMRKSERP